MADLIIMPKLGFNMAKGKLTRWLKQEGETIIKGEILFEIETDKTAMEIEATSSGTVLRLLGEVGEDIPVTLPIAIIGEPGENINALMAEAQTALGKEVTVQATKDTREERKPKPGGIFRDAAASRRSNKISPRARKYAIDNNFDFTGMDIVGTGPDGIVIAADMANCLAKLQQPVVRKRITPLAKKMAEFDKIDIQTLQGSGIGGKITRQDVEMVLAAKEVPVSDDVDQMGRKIREIVPYSGIRKVIGDRLSQSKFTAPHLYFSNSVDMSEVIVLHKRVNETQFIPTSLNDYVILAVAKALKSHPALNACLAGDKIIQYQSVNIGVAVALDNGLIVPVIKDVQDKNIVELAIESKTMIAKARGGKLLPEEYQSGTFTISNLGMFGIENFTAIINPPEAGILGVSSIIKKQIVVSEGGQDIALIRPMMNIMLSVDHRIVDGLEAVKFLNSVKNNLEKPLNILL